MWVGVAVALVMAVVAVVVVDIDVVVVVVVATVVGALLGCFAVDRLRRIPYGNSSCWRGTTPRSTYNKSILFTIPVC